MCAVQAMVQYKYVKGGGGGGARWRKWRIPHATAEFRDLPDPEG